MNDFFLLSHVYLSPFLAPVLFPAFSVMPVHRPSASWTDIEFFEFVFFKFAMQNRNEAPARLDVTAGIIDGLFEALVDAHQRVLVLDAEDAVVAVQAEHREERPPELVAVPAHR